MTKPKPKQTTGLFAKKIPDRRHMVVKGMLDTYWREEMPSVPSLPWSAADAGALGQFLKANPELNVRVVEDCLVNRLQSDDHAPGERVHVWIGNLLRYAQGPLDRFKLLKRTNGEATVGMQRSDASAPVPELPKFGRIREQMGEQWYQRIVKRYQEDAPLSTLDTECLREEGLL